MSLSIIYCTHAIKLRTRLGLNDQGEPTWNAVVSTTGTVHRKRRIIKTSKGEEAESFAFVIFQPTETVSDGMQVSVDGTIYHDALVVDHIRSVFGELMHYEVSL